jgi:hypothetical protein
MDTYLYEDQKTGLCPVGTLITSYNSDSKNQIRIKAEIGHVFNGGCSIPASSKDVVLCRGAKCHDGKSVYELKIKLSKNVLIRIFFVYFNNMVILFDWLKKRHKPDYNKREDGEVKRMYEEKINNTITCYREYCGNNDCLKIVKF